MIKFINESNSIPYVNFRDFYHKALEKKQENIEAVSISSYCNDSNQVNSRFVNLKIIDSTRFIFFSNYQSPKSKQFENNNNIAALIFWSKINLQIRMKAKISKTSHIFNQDYFKNRSIKKNALAISSNQSKKIQSFQLVKENFKKSLQSDNLKNCPEYWGGFVFEPYYFEFWEGHKDRLNFRKEFIKKDANNWEINILQP